MRAVIFSVLFFSFVFSVSTISAQQEKWPSTLLWKISGNGLKEASWLYGTMHVKDRRLFKFSDSLYYAIEKSAGFALEVDFKEFMDSVFIRSFQNAEDRLYDLHFDDKKINKKEIIDSLMEAAVNNKQLRKQLNNYREKRLNSIIKNGEMPTIMDAYLLTIARRLGKWVGGVEDVNDQLNLKDELGANIKTEDLLVSDKELMKSFEKMAQLYLDQDLQEFEDLYYSQLPNAEKDFKLIKRNHKMANSVDSLSKIRTMFYAVGAAHLPGDEGVIKLLRKKGYNVEPVFSDKKTYADKYASGLQKIPWIKMVDNVDSLYSIQLPGIPTEVNMLGAAAKMKVFLDMSSMSFYMTGIIYSFGQNRPLDSLLNAMIENMHASNSKIKKTNIQKGVFQGLEGYIDNTEGHFRIQLFQGVACYYLLMFGTEAKSMLNSNDANQFFSSFLPMAGKKKIENITWKSFVVDDKGFKISLPATPRRNVRLEKSGEGTGWKFTIYDLLDNNTQLYYMVQIRDIDPGYYIDGNKNYFEGYKNVLTSIAPFSIDTISSWKGLPASDLEGIDTETGVLMHVKSIIRGNRVYTISVTGEKSNMDLQVIDKFYDSFEIIPYTISPVIKQTAGQNEFNTSLPFPLIAKTNSDSIVKDSENKHFISYDPYEVVSYEVTTESISPYMWYESDTAYFKEKVLDFISEGDSVVYEKQTRNENLPAYEMLVYMPDNNCRKKVRMVLNGRTLYKLYAIVDEKNVQDKRHRAFFEDFLVTDELPGDKISVNKTQRIFQDLASTDSLIFSNAYAGLAGAPFTIKDISYLHQGLTMPLLDDTSEYYNARERLIDILKPLADVSTVNFIRDNYLKTNNANENFKPAMLAVLANLKTNDSYTLLKDLFINHTPTIKADIYLGWRLKDSSELASILFPEILKLTKDPVWWEEVASVADDMVDSGMVQLSAIMPYKDILIHNADTLLQSIMKEKAENLEEVAAYGHIDLLNLIAKFNDAKSNNILTRFLAAGDLYLNTKLVMLLLKNNQTVQKNIIEKIAEDKYYREDIYQSLKTIGNEKLFPVKYLTQKAMAESYLYNIATDDNPPSEIIYIGERVTNFKGKKAKFYLYKIVYEYDDADSEEYMGIAGPYDMNAKVIDCKHEVSQIYFEQQYSKSEIERIINTIIEKAELDDNSIE